MKNLKKVLAIVLVVALAFSMMAVASAKQVTDFSDASSIKYTEAVDLLTGLGIIQGSGGTTFDPTGTFTREQAAKIIAYVVLGSAVADKLTTSSSSFKDVAATRWSAPFIQYCAANGIINGLGDGTFNPTAPVTGSGMAKLLLTAIGYGAKGEYTGSNWEINTLVKGQSLGILDTGINYSAAATREQVAKYVFNVLTKASCYTVTYNPVTGTYAGNYTSTTPTTEEKLAAGLGALTYKLVKTPATDGAAYPNVTAHYWKANIPSVSVSGVYSDDNVIATSTNGTNLTNLTTASVSNPSYKATTNDTFDIYYNGDLKLDNVSVFTGVVNGTTTANQAADKAGVIVKLIDNGYDGKVDIISIIEKSTVKVTTVPTVDSLTGVTTFANVGGPSFAKGAIVCPASLSLNDVVSYVLYGDTAAVTYVEKATKIVGQATGSTATTLTFAGNSYTMAETANVSIFDLSVAGSYNANASAWLDSNGYLVYTALDSAAVLPYGLLVGYSFVPASGSGLTAVPAYAKAQLYTADGKVAIYDVAATNSDGTVPTQAATFAFDAGHKGYLVNYAFDSNGKVILTSVGTAGNTAASDIAAGSPIVSLDTVGNYYITSATKVIYFDKDAGYSAVSPTNVAAFATGYTNTLKIPANTDVTYIVSSVPSGTRNLDVIVIDIAQNANVAGNYAYVLNTSYGTHFVGTTQYNDYTVYINGTATTVSAASSLGNLFPASGYYSFTKDANGYVVGGAGAPAIVGAVTDGTVSNVEASYIAYTNTTPTLVSYNASTHFYKVIPGVSVASTGIFTLSSTSTTNLVNVQTDPTTGVATAIFYTVS